MVLQDEALDGDVRVVGIAAKVEYHLDVAQVHAFQFGCPKCLRLIGFQREILVHEDEVVIVGLANLHFHAAVGRSRSHDDGEVVRGSGRDGYARVDEHLCLPAFGGGGRQGHRVSAVNVRVRRIGHLRPSRRIVEGRLAERDTLEQVEVAFGVEAAEAVHLGLLDGEILGDGAVADAVGIAHLALHAVRSRLAVETREAVFRGIGAVDDPYWSDTGCGNEFERGGVGGLVNGHREVVGIVRCLGDIARGPLVFLGRTGGQSDAGCQDGHVFQYTFHISLV